MIRISKPRNFLISTDALTMWRWYHVNLFSDFCWCFRRVNEWLIVAVIQCRSHAAVFCTYVGVWSICNLRSS